MNNIVGVLRVIAPDADAGIPPPGRMLPDRHLTFPLLPGNTTLGSDLANALVFFDPSVDARHAAIHYRQNRWMVENCSPDHPLLVEDMPVPPGMMLAISAGQHLRMGAVQMQLVALDLPQSLLALAESDVAGSASASAAIPFNLPSAWQPPRTWQGWLGMAALVVSFVVALALVIVGLGTLITQRELAGSGVNLLATLVLPLTPAAGIMLLIALIDRYERVPWHLLMGAFLWGAIIAIPPAFFIENSLNAAITLLPFGLWPRVSADLAQSALFGLNAGFTEELVKGAGLIVLIAFVRDRFENVTDGILYGAVIGAGFAMTENIAYFATAESSRQAMAFLIVERVILGWLGHSTFTACFGAGLGYLRERRSAFRPWIAPALGFAAAAVLHSFFDFAGFQANTASRNAPGSAFITILALLAIVANYIPLFFAGATLMVMLMRSLAREAGILREFLVDEVRQGVVTPEEYLMLQQASLHTRAQRALLLLRSVPIWWATRTLYATEVQLAFVKWRESLRAEAGEATAPRDTFPPSAFRAKIRRLRRAIITAETPGDSLPQTPFRLPYGMEE